MYDCKLRRKQDFRMRRLDVSSAGCANVHITHVARNYYHFPIALFFVAQLTIYHYWRIRTSGIKGIACIAVYTLHQDAFRCNSLEFDRMCRTIFLALRVNISISSSVQLSAHLIDFTWVEHHLLDWNSRLHESFSYIFFFGSWDKNRLTDSARRPTDVDACRVVDVYIIQVNNVRLCAEERSGLVRGNLFTSNEFRLP